LVFRILDASAFYAGVPFSSLDDYYTTPLVFEEIQHIKKNHDALGILLETKRLKIMDPDKTHTDKIIKIAKDTGDFQQMSEQDISVVALGLKFNGEIVTDDFAISNISKNIGLQVIPIMTSGIKDIGKWVHYCTGCKKNFSEKLECPLCGNSLKRKLLKQS